MPALVLPGGDVQQEDAAGGGACSDLLPVP